MARPAQRIPARTTPIGTIISRMPKPTLHATVRSSRGAITTLLHRHLAVGCPTSTIYGALTIAGGANTIAMLTFGSFHAKLLAANSVTGDGPRVCPVVRSPAGASDAVEASSGA